MPIATILCVDDEKYILSSIKAQLKEHLNELYDIEISESAEEAIQIYNELISENIDIPLVISDQIMPGMKGDEFLKYIYNKNPEIRTIMLTGQAEKDDVIRAVNNANLFRYIGKPWEEEDLILTINTAIQSYYYAREIEIKNKEIAEYNEHLEDMVAIRTKELEDQKRIVEKRNIDLNEQKRIIEEKNNEIISSIQYAEKIQNAILPNYDYMEKLLCDHFVFYKPKDIIGGDFYWVSRRDNEIVIVAADCTGHGVPGALLSILGISLLDRAVNHLNIMESDKILNNIRGELIRSLHQIKEQMSDGMDMSLLIINLDYLNAQFSGANNPLLIVRENTIIEYKGDRLPIGTHPRMKEKFTRQDIKLEPSDMLYLFSDGFIDQFGEGINRKFMIKDFKELLLSVSNEPVKKQKEILVNTFEKWKGSQIQTDDVLVFGIRV